MTASAIIVAAGSGIRLKLDRPKAFATLAGLTLLARSLRTIADVVEVGEAVVAIPPGMEKEARREVVAAGLKIPVKLVAGGAARQDSVRIALALTSAESALVIVHDAARPFASADLFRRCLSAAARTGGAIAAIPVADTLKRVEPGGAGDIRIIAATIPRAALYAAQTPQAFRRALLIQAHGRAHSEGIAATDDAELVERLGERVEIVEASTRNLKITTPDDLALAEMIAAET